MDISARALSLADRPRLGHFGHQGSHAPGRPILALNDKSLPPFAMSGVRQRGIATLQRTGRVVWMAEANELHGGVSVSASFPLKISHCASEPRRVTGIKDEKPMGLLNFLNIFSRTPESHRLDGRSRALLAASFRPLRDGEPGWITMQEARKLFSPVEDSDALGEVQLKFSPQTGRLYLTRRATLRFVTPSYHALAKQNSK
jgi:hypothetical protein